MTEKLLYETVSRVYRFCGKELSKDAFQTYLQFMKFGIIGLSNTAISYFCYSLGLLMFRRFGLFGSVDYLTAQLVAFLLSVLWSFYWNNRFVFRIKDGEKRSLWKALLKTYISYSFTGLFLSSVLLSVWVRGFHLSEFIAPMINLIITVPLNFVMNKLWAFRHSEKENEESEKAG